MLINHTKYQVIYIERNYKFADRITLFSQGKACSPSHDWKIEEWSNHIT